ncbi:MAG: N-methyl-L-tryptophan oxidase [Pseudomonadales bacterium]
MASYDVIVVGLGAMGAAALHHLALRGVKALGIEQFGIPHGQGSSGGDTRLIRKAYFEHPDYVPLLARAYEHWRALQRELGEQLLFETGTLYLGRADGEVVAGSRRAAAEHGLALEQIDARTLAAEFPQFRCPDDYQALFEPEAGFLLCEQAIRAHVEAALARGAALIAGERVLSWRAQPGAVEVVTRNQRHSAAALVFAAGSWSGPLLTELGIDLRVTRQPLFWVQPADPASYALGRFPCWAVQRPDQPGLFYGFPGLPARLTPQLGAKLAHHAAGEPVGADEPRRAADRQELETLLAALAPFVPGLTGAMTGSRVCMYTMSADGHFIVDVHPQHRNVAFGCGFSGHGFKFASVMGEALADLATTGTSPLPIDFLKLR